MGQLVTNDPRDPSIFADPFDPCDPLAHCQRWYVHGATAACALCRSGRLLSLSDSGPGATSVPRPGSQHDERRLRLVHVPANENMAQ